ncbi:MAG TPA: CfrBI family restriction endonuclease [Chloroflexi bacterium]|nr:CfrBI family restriction endonuclease [Chloroflexota bacterium]
MGHEFFIQPEVRKLIEARGEDLIRQLGWKVVRQVIFDIMCGGNLRDATEMLTRRRLGVLNAALLASWIGDERTWEQRLEEASALLERGKPTKTERWIAQWLLGLTDKAFQNVLRDSAKKLADYRKIYLQTLQEVAEESEQTFGPLKGHLSLKGQTQQVEWETVLLLMSAIGAQTLTIRGSEKSLYGKLFEPLVLGTLLFSLGFTFVADESKISHSPRRVFFLSSEATSGRESDATLIYEPGRGIRFDLGFIGRGNPEISLDKVTRFEREMEEAGKRFAMTTLIIVDRIGKRSRLPQLAERTGAHIVQMSMGYWPKIVAEILYQEVGYEHCLLGMEDAEVRQFLRDRVAEAPLEEFLRARLRDNG